MSTISTPSAGALKLPTHLDLPDSDGRPVENCLELPQSMLLTDSIVPVLRRRHPDGMFAIGSNSGIYWKITDPPLDGCRAPDWYYIPGVHPGKIDGHYRRSYVLWQEKVVPFILLEFASGDGSEERDRTPETGKFWVYEQGIRAPIYGIFNCETSELQMNRLVQGRYQRQEPNERGHFSIPEMGVELGTKMGTFLNITWRWMRWFDLEGTLIPIGHEIAEQAQKQVDQVQKQVEQVQKQVEQAQKQAEQAQQRADRLAEQLRKLGVSPENGP